MSPDLLLFLIHCMSIADFRWSEFLGGQAKFPAPAIIFTNVSTLYNVECGGRFCPLAYGGPWINIMGCTYVTIRTYEIVVNIIIIVIIFLLLLLLK